MVLTRVPNSLSPPLQNGDTVDQHYLDAAREMIVAALGDRLASGVENFASLFRDDGVLETPFDGDETTSQIAGKANIRAMIRNLQGVVPLESPRSKAVHRTADDETVIHGYGGVVRNARTGRRFSRSYAAFAVVCEVRPALLREHACPLAPIPQPSKSWAGSASAR